MHSCSSTRCQSCVDHHRDDAAHCVLVVRARSCATSPMLSAHSSTQPDPQSIKLPSSPCKRACFDFVSSCIDVLNKLRAAPPDCATAIDPSSGLEAFPDAAQLVVLSPALHVRVLPLSRSLFESRGLELIDGDDGGRAGERAMRVSSGAGIEREDGASGVVRASVVELVPSVGLPGRRLWRSVRSARLLDRISRCHRFVSLSLSLSLARALCERRRGCLLLCTRLIDRLMDGAL